MSMSGPQVAAIRREDHQRVWRVGAVSTGVTLILMGITLAASLWLGAKSYVILSWIAPLIFIMLGAEVLLYLKFARSGNAGVRYDWFSIFMVALVGLASLALTLLMSTGLFDELQRGLKMTQRSAFVEAQGAAVPQEIQQIVVHSLSRIEINEAAARELQLFGQVRYWSAEKLEPAEFKLLQTNIVGTTMYVMVGVVDRRDGGLISDTIDMQLTLVVPEGIEIHQR